MPFLVRATAPQSPLFRSKRPQKRSYWGASASALVALLASSQALAQADQQCGPVVAGTVQCAPAEDGHPTGVRYDLSAQPPQDLTVILPPETIISTADDETAGISISTGGGAISVSGAGSSVQTSGWRSTGVRAVTAGGDVTVEAGTVATTGYRADGILADAGIGGAIHITADQVSTSGEASVGVRANTPNGDISIHTGVVSTYGFGSDAIYAATSNGNTVIQTGEAYAWGGSGRAIVGYASGTTTVRADYVGTSGGGGGTESDATAVTAIGTAVDVAISGSVRTSGDYATGIYARSNLVYSDPTIVPTISVSAGSVSTSGTFSHGVVALNYAQGGATHVDIGNIDTRGDNSFGVYAGGQGDVTVKTGNVTTLGTGSEVVHAVSFGGDIAVTTGTISTSGESAHGVYAINYSQGAVAVTTGDVKTRRDYSIGVAALSLGNVSVNTGKVQVSGYGSQGIVAYSVFGSVDVHAGAVSTAGGKGTGIGAYTFAEGQNIHVTAGPVETLGDYAAGILALATRGTATIDVTGTVQTAGTHSEGIAASGVALEGGDAVTIHAGTVITSGGGARGISAQGIGDVSITVDKVLTSGGLGGGRHSTWAEGILASTYGGTIRIDAGTVETTGRGGAGIDTQANSGNAIIKVDRVTTAGDHAPAIVTSAFDGATTIDAGTVITTGDDSEGILARSFVNDPYSDADRSLSIKAGSIATSGIRSDALYAVGGDAISIDVGSISTTGDDSRGIYAVSTYDSVQILAGDVKTTGTGSVGIFALTPYGSVNVQAGTVETHGAGTHAIRAGGLSSTVAVKGVTITGEGAIGVDMLAAHGSASLSAGTITGSGARSVGAAVLSFGGDASVQADSIKLTGYGSVGIDAIADHGNTTVKAGTVDVGEASRAIGASAYIGDTIVTVGSIRSGGSGIMASAGLGNVVVTSGDISTTGEFGKAVYTNANGGSSSVTLSGNVTTTGKLGFGVQTTSVGGDNSIENKGRISTSGAYAIGIIGNTFVGNVRISGGTVHTSGDHAGGIQATAVGPQTSVTVTAAEVVTTGDHSDGIVAQAPLNGSISFSTHGAIAAVPPAPPAGTIDRSVFVTSGIVRVSGQDSIGVRALAAGNVTIDATTTSAVTGPAIKADAYGDVAITVRGATTSQGNAIVATGENVALAIGAGGSVSGVNGIVVSAATRVPPPDGGVGGIGFRAAAADAGHRITLTNAGLLEGGSGYALRVDAGTATITNSGTIKGRLLLGDGDDLLTNTGVFLAVGDSDFGTGNDRFVNQGTFRVGTAGAQASSVTLLGLERFENTGGTIDLSNGHAGDTLTLPKDYVGSNGARIALDVGGGTADRLVIGGAATGSTAVLLADVGNANAVLTGQAPIALIQAGAGSSANAFTLAVNDIGLVHYDLGFDAASGKYLLRNAAGAPVYRLARLNETLANAWSRGTDTVATHLAGIRDAATAQPALWGTFGGASERIRQTRSINGGDVAVGYRQDEVEARIGYDFGGGNGGRPGFGLTGGYINSKVNFTGSAAHATADSFDFGGYGRLSSGRFFANGSVNVAFHSLKIVDRSLGYSDDVSGRSVGAQAEAGARFGGGAFFVEPSARLSWSHTSLDDVAALNQTVSLDSLNSVRGTFGARLGGTTHLGSTQATFYGGLHYVHEFAGKSDATLFSSTASDTVAGLALPDQVRASIGANIGGTGPVSGFVQADGAFGSGRRGAGGRIGIRFGF